MGFSSQMDLIRSLLLRFHVLSRRRKWVKARHAVGCMGRWRGLSIPTLSSLRSLREEPPEQRRKRRRKKKSDRDQSIGSEEVIVSLDGIRSAEEEYGNFTAMHPGYLETLVVDELRDEEYGELQEDGHVCLDYSGYGLFSQLQQELDSSSSSFAITHIPGDLSAEALHDRPTEGTVECDIRRRIMRFLNIQEGEYGMVFTASKGRAFKLLAESYPFDAQRSLLTMYDYESEAVRAMQESAQCHGARALAASFSFPSLSVCSTHLKEQVLCNVNEDKNKDFSEDMEMVERQGDKAKKKKKKRDDRHGECSKAERGKDDQKGLFVFPVQSRVSGTRYSYQWMSLAQDNGWHVLLDASALGPKDMDSLGLSLFQPDFIVTSFYKVFGSDPTGFGCLFVKNSSMSILCQSVAARDIGMVRLVPLPGASSPSDPSREKHHNASFSTERNTSNDILSNAKDSMGEEPIQAQVAFSGPASTLFKWKASMKGANGIKMVTYLEEKSEEDSVPLKVSTGTMDGHPVEDAQHLGWCTSKSHTEDLVKTRIPITPRSVLEESLLEGLDHSNDGESHELEQFRCGGSHGLTELEGNADLVCGEFSDKQIVLQEIETLRSPLESMKLTSHNVPNKRDLMMYYSHEIACHGSTSTCKVAFSQPLISRDIRENPFLVHSEGSSLYDELDFSSSLYDEDEDDEESSDWDNGDDPFNVRRREPEIYCRGLNHADTLGLNKTNDRLRFLTNWLINSIMKLQHLVSNRFEPLVHLYGPKAKYERGASLAFNLFDRSGALVQPALVQELAQRDNISVGLGMLSHIRFPEGCVDLQDVGVCGDAFMEPVSSMLCQTCEQGSLAARLQVVTATLGFFTNFEDVYRLWAFVAKFLDAEFLEHNLHGIAKQ